MARLVTSGWEWDNPLITEAATAPDGQLTTGGTITVSSSTANPRSGLRHLRAATGSPIAGHALTEHSFAAIAAGTDLFVRVYFFVTALPTSTNVASFIGINGNATGVLAVGELTSAGLRVRAWDPTSSSSKSVSSDQAITLSAWNCLEIRIRVGVGAVDEFEARLNNGASFHLATGLSLGDATPVFVMAGLFSIGFNGSIDVAADCVELNYTMDLDDLAANDSTGAAQNSWPGSGKIVLAKAISLNANGGSWTDDNAATTSAALAAAVDNTPPVGIADTTAGGGGHQDRNAAANTSLDLNLSTYASLGIGIADTINAVVPMCNTGAPVVTGAKAGSLGLVSNPTITNIAFVNGASAAANFWQGVAAGTYPTGWKWEKGTITYNPTVVLGTSPVFRVTITGGTTTRIAMVDAVGLYIDYTPIIPPAPADLPPATPLLVTLMKGIAGKLRRLHDNILVPDFQALPPTFVYVDADTASSVTSIASTESTDFVDGDTPSSISSVSAIEIAADVDANTISSTTVVSSLDTAGFVDANTPASVTSLISTELYTPYIDRAFVTPLLITLGEKIKLFRLLNDNILGETPQITSVDYLDSATISSATSVSSSEISAYVDTGTTSSTTTPSTTDVLGALESNTIASTTSITTNDVISGVDSSTGAIVTTVTSTETAQYTESSTITSNTSISSLEEHDIPDSATVSSQSSIITSDLYSVVDPSTGATITIVISLESAQYVDSGTISSTTTLTTTDVAAYVDSSTVSSVTSISATELHEIPDTGTVSGTTVVTSADLAAYVDSSTLSTTTSLTYTEVAAYVDGDIPASVTSISSSDSYLQAPVPSSIQVLLIKLARYHSQLKLLGSNTLSSPQPSGAVYTESATISTTTLVVSNDVAAFIDSNTITSKSVPSSSDTVDFVDSLSIAGKTSVSTIDTAAYLDAATANGTTTPSFLDTSAYVDSALIFSTTSPQPVEAFGLTEAATVTNTTTLSSGEIANYVDSLTAFTLTSVLSTETTDYVDSGTASSFTSISYTEQKVTAPTFIDSATITTTTTLPHTYEYGPIVEISLFGTATQRWNADKTVGRYSVAIDKKWNGTSMIGRYEATSKHRWEV